MALSGGIVLEEAVDLSSDRLLMMMSVSFAALHGNMTVDDDLKGKSKEAV
jgi:hypothetical protein